MAYVLGLDIGTSYTAAAVHRVGADAGGGPQPLRLGSRHDAVPSVVFLPEDGPMLVGEAAERRGLGQPDRMVREFKRRVGDPVPIVAGDAQVLAEDLVAAMAIWVVARAAEQEGELPTAVALAHPAGWGTFKTGLIQSALERAGLPVVTLLPEPVAAARHYASQQRVEPGSCLAVYDLGGGTFDVAILRTEEDGGFTLLGSPDGIEELGGRDFDDAVFRHVLAAVGDRMPDFDPEDPETALALARLRRECVEAKEALSFDSEATVPVLMPGLTTQVRLLRSEFEALIDDRIEETIAALAAAADSAGVGVDGLSTVLLVGGSSRIPLVAELISAELDRPVAIDVDPKAAIAFGTTAFAAAQLAPAFPISVAEIAPIPAAAAAAVPAPDRAARVRILFTAAAAVAGLLVLAGPASPTSTSTGPFAATGQNADAAADVADAAAATEEAPPTEQAPPAAAPVDSGDPTPNLFEPAVRSRALAPNPSPSSRPAAQPATSAPSTNPGTVPAANGGATGGPVTAPGGSTTDPGTDPGSATPPGDGTTTPPGGGTTTPPGGGTTTPPGDGTTTPPGDGTTTPPGDGTTTPPGDGTTTPPGDGTTTPPGDGTTNPPGDGDTTPPDGGTTTPPGQAPAGDPLAEPIAQDPTPEQG